MTIDELRREIVSYRKALTEKGKAGHMVRFTSTGPVGMPLIDKLVEVMEMQQRQIDDLRAKINPRGETDGADGNKGRPMSTIGAAY
ncbi:MAG TPA: hypothetical protein VGY55_06045 [Pirellulales bacterium]|jgi:hypothetical protein|nr:hypothetical protein [Pirellulales bacterium]